IKLVDVPELNYTSEDKPHPHGEICVKGSQSFLWLLQRQCSNVTNLIVLLRKVIDGDGWLYSGDIGLWLPGGRLKIIDEIERKIEENQSFRWEKGAYIAQYNQEMVIVVASDVEAGVMDAGVLSVCKGFLGIASVGAVCLVGELMVVRFGVEPYELKHSVTGVKPDGKKNIFKLAQREYIAL
ncbi:hypothetical protein F8388_015793, partial [Cannabis sativa]